MGADELVSGKAIEVKKIGDKIDLTDITVTNAGKLRDFYCRGVGWNFDALEMRGYEDFTMKAADSSSAAGICHK